MGPVAELIRKVEKALSACSQRMEEKEEDIKAYVRKLISHREKIADFSDVDPEGEENRRYIDRFRELHRKGEAVDIFNVYKGLHVKGPAMVVNVERDGVVLEVRLTQLRL